MNIGVTFFDAINIDYINESGEQKTEFLPGTLDLAKTFVKNHSVISIKFFVEIIISENNANTARQPHKKFAEQSFTAEEFLTLSNNWMEEAKEKATTEVDAYMAEAYSVTVV